MSISTGATIWSPLSWKPVHASAGSRRNCRRGQALAHDAWIPTVYPVIAYSLTSTKKSLTELRHLALFQLRPALDTIAGVAKVGVQGGQTEEWRVVVDQAKLRSFNMGLSDVVQALSQSNVLTTVGRARTE